MPRRAVLVTRPAPGDARPRRPWRPSDGSPFWHLRSCCEYPPAALPRAQALLLASRAARGPCQPPRCPCLQWARAPRPRRARVASTMSPPARAMRPHSHRWPPNVSTRCRPAAARGRARLWRRPRGGSARARISRGPPSRLCRDPHDRVARCRSRCDRGGARCGDAGDLAARRAHHRRAAAPRGLADATQAMRALVLSPRIADALKPLRFATVEQPFAPTRPSCPRCSVRHRLEAPAPPRLAIPALAVARGPA